MAYKDFTNDFKKGIEGELLFFYGAEDFLMDWAVQQVVSKYVGAESVNLDLQHLDGETCSASDIIAAGKTYSMFSERRVVVVRNFLPTYKKVADAGSEELLAFCRDKQNSAVVVFQLESKFEKDLNAYGKKLAKSCSAYDFSALDRATLKTFINKRVHAAGKLLGSREMEYLIELSGYYLKESTYRLSDLVKDLEKINNACETDRISSGLIEEILVGEEDRFVFNLIDALMAGDKRTAMTLAETIITDDGAIPVTALLIKQFEIMYDALELSREGYSMKDMAQMTGVNDFRFKKAFQAARGFTIDRLRKILVDAYNINRDMVTGNMDKDLAFELLISSI